jgi:hypothetical protein
MGGSWWISLIVLLPTIVVGGYYMWRRYRHWLR